MRTLAVELTYATLLAIVPLLAILFTIAKSFGLSTLLREQFSHLLTPIGKTGGEVSQYLFQFIDNAQPGVLGPIGVLFLFYTAFGLIHKVENSLNQIWQVNESRMLIRKVTRYAGALIYIIIVAMVAVAIKVGVWQNAIDSVSTKYAWLNPFINTAASIVSVLITALLLAMLYSSFPNTKVKALPALVGGLFTAISWIPLTWIFTKTVAASANYSAIYSSFAGLVITLIWLQYAWILFLSGAVLSYLVQYPIMMRLQSHKPLNPAQLEHYALQIMHLIIDNFKAGQGGMTLSALMHATKLSKPQLYSVVQPFIDAKMLRELHHGGNEFILNTSIGNLSDSVVRETVRGEL